MDRRACFLGDSYTAGAGDDTGLGWVGRVAAAARGEGIDLTAYNLGVRGETGPQIAARAEAELPPRLALGDSHAMVFSFGSNDFNKGVTQAESLAATARLLDLARRLNIPAFGVSSPVFLDDAQLDRRSVALSGGMANLFAQAGAAWLDLRTSDMDWRPWWDEAGAGDGYHPNSAGYAALAKVVAAWPAWRAWLRGQG
ncbi:lysophospholipase L1-like esterase [Caulobacter ginsengisoli]|uniref:Lysophospholipase L1-like esterase n=1 Tax=Caulobacter ginsengisoli TaxID=400775 RepID=A0ABU0IM62_9CAUL|nr:GDSL-type esterase/lipase family protein [Caulobacter ginsengisoli]MDQ0463054.1 lysophospholipase L1-like esterase [Caulobacter ginsengisoli]